MNILNCGDVIWATDIIFKDGIHDIEERGHPAIVLFPTSEEDESAFCIYMTSNRRKGKIPISLRGLSNKSYINIETIAKNYNYKAEHLSEVPNDLLYSILKDFYAYQQKQPHAFFPEIKEKIESVLEIFRINDELGILMDTDIDYKDLNIFSESKKPTIVYIAKLVLLGEIEIKDISLDLFNRREIYFLEELIKVFKSIKNLDFSKIKMEDHNNKLRELYINVKNTSLFANTNELFESIIDVMVAFNEDEDKIEVVKIFLNKEMERDATREEKRKARIVANKEKAKRKRNSEKGREDYLLEKYGYFDFDQFK